MGGADHAGLAVGEQDRRAIGGEDAEREAGPVGDDRVGMRAGVVGPGRVGIDARPAEWTWWTVTKARARRDRLDRAAAILGDRVAVVVRAPADIEAGADAGRDAAPPAEEAVRHAGQRGGADHLDGHHRSSLITGS